MERVSIQEIKNAVRGNFESSPDAEYAAGVSTDTRTLMPGDLFIALEGQNFDGHDYISKAEEKGAAAVICTKGKTRTSGIGLIGVSDTLQALGDLAAHYRKKFSTRVIAVTGSNGKTTTKDMIHHVLSASSAGVKSIGNMNNLVGLPLSVFQLDPTQAFAVLEMGTSAPGEISRLSKIASPQIAVVTSVTETHLEKLNDIEGVASAKAEITHGMNDEGFLVVNGDDERCLAIGKRFGERMATFGFDNKADVRCVKRETRDLRTVFHLADGTVCDLPLLGTHSILNALACITTCIRIGVSKKDAAAELSTFVVAEMRGGISRQNGITLINDSYNANPAGFRSAIGILLAVNASRRILVCGAMKELGERSDQFHHSLGRSVARFGMDIVVCVGSAAAIIGEEALAKGMSQQQVLFFDTAAAAISTVTGLLREGDAVLVKGSREMKMEVIANGIKEAGNVISSSISS